MEQLYNKLEELPYKAEWIEKNVTLIEDPSEQHLIEYRIVVAAIKSLWSDPRHADNLVCCPEKMYSDSDHTTRLYNEMWTGQWWWKVQDALPLLGMLV